MFLCRKSLTSLRGARVNIRSNPPLLTTPFWHVQPLNHSRNSSTTATNSTNANPYMEGIYEAWKKDPKSVHPSWEGYFRELDSKGSPPVMSAQLSGDLRQQISDSMRLVLLVRAYQVRGHEIAKLDPLGMDVHPEPPELDHRRYGFTEEDMDRDIYIGSTLLAGFLSAAGSTTTLRKIIEKLRATYCGTIGVEYTHIQEREKLDWVRERFETQHIPLSKEKRLKLLERLAWACLFETFLQKKYKGTRRFGLDGGESLIPGLKTLIDEIAERGVTGVVMGMPHRGRLNVLANVVRKPIPAIFHEFEGGVITAEDEYSSGDVKYHLGTSYDRITHMGRKVHLSLVANPSHLEAVNPVVEGKVRAKQYYKNDTVRAQILPILIHGDAAFAGQGVVYETLHFADLVHYTTGGTVHVIANNQIGFTTDPKSSRSSRYPTDVAKTLGVPIFHVNGDDPEAVVRVFELAAEWRQTFHKDVVVDIICYRRYGHNEIDMPHFTQPVMYQKIDTHPNILKVYSDQLIAAGVVTEAEVLKLIEDINVSYEKLHQEGLNYTPSAHDWLSTQWAGIKGPKQTATIGDTGIAQNTLHTIGKALYTAPSDFTPHPTIKKLLSEKEKMFTSEKGIDWATAEALAFGSLVSEGTHVRLSGQDVERGTFSHRHSVLHDQKTGATYTPLQHVDPKQAGFTVCNSSLSEFGVLGFELGYSLESPQSLVLWEAQFGDFSNGAQVMIDQFVSSGEQKWMRQSGLTMILPHGYDGAGPEHSSARLERFLGLCDSDPCKIPPKTESERNQIQRSNWQIVYPTTPANYFHALRRQIHRDFRKPMVVFMSKYLLRYQPTFSSVSDFTKESGAKFLRLIPEATPEALVAPDKVERIVFCSGQVYYNLLKARTENKIDNVALVRIEQLYPFPFDLVTEQVDLYPNAELLWCQEEPMNMGAWSFIFRHIDSAAKAGSPRKKPTLPRYSGRPVSASPAVASVKLHTYQLEKLLNDALNIKKA